MDGAYDSSAIPWRFTGNTLWQRTNDGACRHGSYRNSLYHLDDDDTMTVPCEKCPLRGYAGRNPGSPIARIWKWHTGWCPGWKAYQRSLSQK